MNSWRNKSLPIGEGVYDISFRSQTRPDLRWAYFGVKAKNERGRVYIYDTYLQQYVELEDKIDSWRVSKVRT